MILFLSPLSGSSASQQRALTTWRAQWELDRQLQSAQLDEAVESQRRRSDAEVSPAAYAAPFEDEPDVAAGQIRLLAPEMCPQDCIPVYVAVLAEVRVGAFLVAPFSRFQDPATPCELRLRGAPPALAVLALWNARPVSAFVLHQSWFVDALTPKEIEDASAVLQSVARPAALPAQLAERVGAPLLDPLDARFDYINEAGEVWRDIASFPADTEVGEVIRFPAAQEIAAEAALQLAAESEASFACVSVVAVAQRGLLVHVFARLREKVIFLVVSDLAGEASAELDGTLVFLQNIGLAGRIGSAQSVVQADAPADLALRDPSGHHLHLSKVDGPSSVRPFSYVRLVGMLGSNPDAVSVLTDSELRRLIRSCPREPAIEATLKAEVCFRAWLYEGASREELRAELAGCGDPEIDRWLDGPLATVRMQQAWHRDAVAAVEIGGGNREVWQRLVARIRSFVQADGIIPVVTGESAEAVPIAFNLRTSESPETAIRDVAGVPVPLWDKAEEIFGDLLAQRIGVQFQCSIRGTGRQFAGESLELPIVLALARRRGALPDYPPLSVLASGAIRGDTVAPVSGIDAKLALARRMGVKLFITPGAADSEFVMGAPAGTGIQDLLGTLAARLEHAGLDRLDTRAAAARLNSLGDEIHMGIVSLTEAAMRLKRYEDVLGRDAGSKIAAEGLIRAKVLRGAIANHSGDPQAGARATREAATLAAKLRMPLLYVNAVANRIVSLTDLGHLPEAESEGRRLLGWVLDDFSGPSAEQMQAEMVACGVLGGQALLHLALHGAGCGPESLGLLSRALELATELQMPADTCRDAVQIALWHALLDPPRTEAAVAEAQAILERHPGEWLTACHAYLLRARFLGAYRSSRYCGIRIPGAEGWPLPECRVAALDWVCATARKYRGVLLAEQGALDAAEQDFAAAWTALDRESAPLLRFIGGTAALAAGEAMLDRNRPLAVAYLEKAKAVFSLQADRLGGPVKGALWLGRAEGLLRGAPAQDLPAPQRFSPY